MRFLTEPASLLMSVMTAVLLAASPLSVRRADAGSRVMTKRPQPAEFEKMTWVEVKDALAAGRTTMLIYTGGVEQRGPQNANGGHNQMASATVKAIAERLGNALFVPCCLSLQTMPTRNFRARSESPTSC